MSGSATGRRVLVAVVTGELGERIQAWRRRYDPAQARRIPPHATLCYWAPLAAPERVEAQVRHAFPAPVVVRLGRVREFANQDHTFYVEVLDTAELDAARRRLHDGTHLSLPAADDWTWHVTCVRRSRAADRDRLRQAALDLTLNAPWLIDTIAYLELRGDVYETVAEWRLA
jgi:2'-5' RNA ligase